MVDRKRNTPVPQTTVPIELEQLRHYCGEFHHATRLLGGLHGLVEKCAVNGGDANEIGDLLAPMVDRFEELTSGFCRLIPDVEVSA